MVSCAKGRIATSAGLRGCVDRGLNFDKLSNLNPIITVAEGGIHFVKSLGVADHTGDCRNGNVVDDIRKSLDGKPLHYGFDAISLNKSWESIVPAVTLLEGKTFFDPPEEEIKWPEGLVFSRTYVASTYGEQHSRRSREDALRDIAISHSCSIGISLCCSEKGDSEDIRMR